MQILKELGEKSLLIFDIIILVELMDKKVNVKRLENCAIELQEAQVK